MASELEIRDLVEKALADEEFREILVEDPARAAASRGVDQTPEQAAEFRAAGLSQVEGLDERLTKRKAFG